MSKRPNILLFVTDGMQGRVLTKDHVCHTPNHDRVAERGVAFRRAYTPTPTCSPARASLMTGLLAHNHGVLQVEHCVDDDQSVLRTEKPHWAQRLVKAGYRTGYFGKWHIERSSELEDFGWQVNGCERRDLYSSASRDLTRSEEDHLDEKVQRWQTDAPGYEPRLHYAVTDVPVQERRVSIAARLAKEFLGEALEQTQPWCCCVSYPYPNEAMICSRETFDMYDVDHIDLPPNLNDELANRPAIYRRTQQLWRDITDRQWQEARACYYARITEVDSQLGMLLDQIESAGQMKNTVVVATSDHGKYVGGHGMEAHNFGAFEEIYNIPLLVSAPNAARGLSTEARVGLHDLCPTLLELAGADPIDVPDSTSFVEVLQDPSDAKGRFRIGYAEYHGTRFPLMQRVLWADEWKLVFNGFDFDELYDLENDPYEMNNLATDPDHQERLHAMMREIWAKVRETNDRTLRETQYYSMRFACVGPECD